MYYEEKIIGGILHARSTPNGVFRPLTLEVLTARLEAKDARLEAKNDVISEMKTEKNTLLNALHRIQSVYDWKDDFAGKIAHEVLTQFNYSFNENGSIISE